MTYSLKKFKAALHKRHFIDCNPTHKSSILLAGTGRSGTTWVSDIINYKNEYRYIFEPFHPHNVPLVRNFRYRQYLRPENRVRAFLDPAGAILSGKIRNAWTDKENNRFISRKRLIKDIRVNLLLRWMYANFPEMPIVLVMRHPCAVASSKLQLHWETHLDEFLAQDELMEDFLDPFRKEIEHAHTVFEEHIFLWCIENYVPLHQFKSGEVFLLFYESLCKSPADEIRKLFSFLGKKYDNAALANLKTPSSQSRTESAILTGASLIESWRRHISSQQIKRAIEVLHVFGLDSIYSEDSFPDTDAASGIMGSTCP